MSTTKEEKEEEEEEEEEEEGEAYAIFPTVNQPKVKSIMWLSQQ
jgi:hypothetical protein